MSDKEAFEKWAQDKDFVIGTPVGRIGLKDAAWEAWQAAQAQAVNGSTSDGYHTFDELYEFRKAYNAALFNELAANNRGHVHKSWKHHDGEPCFGGGWFIVVAVLPDGQISNHYEAKDWDLFRVAETEKALFEFDGHTGADVIARLCSYKPQTQAGDVVNQQLLEALESCRSFLEALCLESSDAYQETLSAIAAAQEQK
jgi:hypothetical protein